MTKKTETLQTSGRIPVGTEGPRKPEDMPSRPPKTNSRGRKALTPRERTFVEGVAEGKTDKQAALDAGYSLSMAENTKQKLWTKPQVQKYFERMLRMVAPPERILHKMSELIDGRFLTKKRRRTLDAAGQLVEETIEEIEIVNPSASLRATIKAAEWAGYVQTKLPEIALDTITHVSLRPGQKREGMLVDVNRKLAPPSLSNGDRNRGIGHEPAEGATEESPREGDATVAKTS